MAALIPRADRIIPALLVAAVGLALLLPPGKALRNWSYDLPFLGREDQLLHEVATVYLDEKSFQDLQQAPARFDRRLHGELVRRLHQDGARLIVFDLLFLDDAGSTNDADPALATALQASGRVVLGAPIFEDSHLPTGGHVVRPPLDLFRDSAAGWGLVNVHRDEDFAARRILPGTNGILSLAEKALELAHPGDATLARASSSERWLNYYSPLPLDGISYSDALRGDRPPGFTVRDKVVFVGSGAVAGYTGDKREHYRYPWTWLNGHFPLGVDIHALTFANLARRDWLERFPAGLEALLIALVGLGAGFGLSALRPLAAAGAFLAALALTAAAGVASANYFDRWWPWLIPAAVQLPLALTCSLLVNSVRTLVHTRVLETSLARYLSPAHVRQILKHPGRLQPGAELQTISILFSDIAGFSKISERMDPEDLGKLLNAYYETAIRCVHATGGTVMNIIGDAIFAIWNAPQPQADHQMLACRAALRLNEALIEFESASRSLPLNTRVGLHTGPACVGNIGSSARFDYTAVGENVNLASRLEGLNKRLGTRILASRELQKAVEGTVPTRRLGHFRFKGFDQVVEVHEILSPNDAGDERAPWRQSFATALNRFERKAWTEAAAGFCRCLELRPSDGASQFYLDQIQRLTAAPPAADWFGEVALDEK